MSKAWDIRAWTYEADMHCEDCALNRFGPEGLEPKSGITDSEGNTPKPVFESDEAPEQGEYCGTCGVMLSEPQDVHSMEHVLRDWSMGGGLGTFAEALSVWCERARTRINLSKAELAQRADVSLDTVYRIEDGRGENIGQETVNAVANALGVPHPTIGRVLLLSEECGSATEGSGWAGLFLNITAAELNDAGMYASAYRAALRGPISAILYCDSQGFYDCDVFNTDGEALDHWDAVKAELEEN